MNCQNCKHWVEGYCMVTGSLVDKDVLCNAWELSLSWEQVAETQPATDRTAELKVGGYFVELEKKLDTEKRISNQLYLLLVGDPKTKKLADDLIEAIRGSKEREG